MKGLRMFEVSMLFRLSPRKGEQTSLKSELEVPRINPRLSKFTMQETPSAGSPPLKILPSNFVGIKALMSLSHEPNSGGVN